MSSHAKPQRRKVTTVKTVEFAALSLSDRTFKALLRGEQVVLSVSLESFLVRHRETFEYVRVTGKALTTVSDENRMVFAVKKLS